MRNIKGEHLEIILQELFRRVGDEYSDEKTQDDGWYWAHEWTTEERDDFINWMTTYLMTHKEARHEIMRFPIRHKKRCYQVATWFGMNYGWKIKEK